MKARDARGALFHGDVAVEVRHDAHAKLGLRFVDLVDDGYPWRGMRCLQWRPPVMMWSEPRGKASMRYPAISFVAAVRPLG